MRTVKLMDRQNDHSVIYHEDLLKFPKKTIEDSNGIPRIWFGKAIILSGDIDWELVNVSEGGGLTALIAKPKEKLT